MRKFLLTVVAAGVALAIAPVAKADMIFTIGADSNFSGSGSPIGPFGTVTVIDGTVLNGLPIGTAQVQVKLAPNVFANTSAADTLEFSLANNPTLTASNITNLLFSGPGGSSSSFTLDLNPSVPHAANVTGFGIGLNCTTCGNGTSAPLYNALTFDITDGAAGGVKATSFVAGDTAGYFFLADLGIPNGAGGFNTGYSGSGPGTTCTNCGVTQQQSSVLEPSSLALLGLGLAGVGFARRRRSA